MKRKRRTRESHVSRHPLERLAQGGLLGLIAILPMMLGTTTSRPWLLFGALWAVLTLFSCWMIGVHLSGRSVRFHPIWLLFLAGTAFVVFQIVPLPQGIPGLLSPKSLKIQQISLEKIGLYSPDLWLPLSVDISDTWLAVSGFGGLLLIYLMAANLLADREGLHRFAQVFAGTAFLLSMIGFFQKALGTQRIFGWIAFEGSVPYFFSTYVNPNNLAAFLGMAVPLQLGLALKSRELLQRLFALIMAVATSVALFMTLSKGGIIAFVAGQVFFAFLLWRRGREGRDLVWVQAAVFLILLLSAWMALDELGREFQADDGLDGVMIQSKETLWENSLAIARDFPLVGSGLETFETIYPSYKTLRLNRRVYYPENIFLQIVTESGFVIGSFAILAFLLQLFALFLRRGEHRLELAGLSSLTLVLVHNYVDFNLNLYSVAVPFVILLAILVGKTFTEGTGVWRYLNARRLPKAFLGGFGAIFILLILYGQIEHGRNRVAESWRRLHAVVYDRTVDDKAFQEVLAREIERHPTDYYLWILASERYLSGSRSEFPLKLQALENARRLNPSSPTAYRMIGNAYAAVGDPESAGAYYKDALSLTDERKEILEIWRSILRNSIEATPLIRSVTLEKSILFGLVEFLKERKREDLAVGLLSRWLSEKDTLQARVRYELGILHLHSGRFSECERVARKLLAEFGTEDYGDRLMAELALKRRNLDEAAKWCQRADQKKPGNIDRLLFHSGVLLQLGRLDEAETLIERIHRQSWKHPAHRASAFFRSGQLAEERKKLTRAAEHYRRSLEFDPDRLLTVLRLSEVLEMVGDTRQARLVCQEALDRGLHGPALRKRLDSLSRNPSPQDSFLP